MSNTGFLIQPKQKKEVRPSEYTTMGDFPAVGQQYVYYKALDTGIFYKWDGDSYEVINPAMDINNQFTSVSGLPQTTMDNPLDSPTYRVLNTTACPVDPSEQVNTLINTSFNDDENKFVTNFSVSKVLTEDLDVQFRIFFKEDGVSKETLIQLFTLPSGELEYVKDSPYSNEGVITEVNPVILSVNPNPNGSKTIMY